MSEFLAELQPTCPGPSANASIWRIRLAGELDLCTGRQLLSAIDHCLQRHAGRLILDLHRLEFLDSEGIRALLRARSRASQNGCQICLVCSSNRGVERLATLVGLDRLFPILRDQAQPVPVPEGWGKGEPEPTEGLRRDPDVRQVEISRRLLEPGLGQGER